VETHAGARRRRFTKNDDGAVLVEFALSLPLLLLIIVGIFDFGLAFQQLGVVTNAAREGARMAVLPGYSTPDIQNRVIAYLQAGGVTVTPQINVTPHPPDAATPFATMEVEVRVDYTFKYLAPFAQMFGGTFGTVTLPARSTMRTEVADEGS
jgi:Flp pilus assembly protein TadG